MSLVKHVVDRLKSLGAQAEAKSQNVTITLDGITSIVRFDDEMEEAWGKYNDAKTSKFDSDDRTYIHNNRIEIPLTRLDPDVYRDSDELIFTDDAGNIVSIHRASLVYQLAHFESDDYEKFFNEVVRVRLTRSQVKYTRSANIILRAPVCATYSTTTRRIPQNFKALSFSRIQSCLAKLAIERRACYEIAKARQNVRTIKLDPIQESDWKIPKSTFEPDLISYYKVARSSPFPSQSFLAYYHVLEYYFLKVTEDALHHQLQTYLNRVDFKVNTNGLDKVIALVRRHGSTDDETDMLRKVLQRFIPEQDFIDHVSSIEATVGEKLYSKRRTVFGEQLEITLKEGHALSNSAKIIKHVRNAIVHSSDRYRREECHIPLSDSELTIGEFLPLMKYFAEQVLYGTATPAAS